MYIYLSKYELSIERLLCSYFTSENQRLYINIYICVCVILSCVMCSIVGLITLLTFRQRSDIYK